MRFKVAVVFLTVLVAFGELNWCVAGPVSEGHRLEYKGDLQAFVQSLPDSVRKDSRSVAVITALATGYPKDFQGVEIGSDKRLMVCLAGGKFVYDDGVTKSFQERLDNPDIKDMFYDRYPLTNPTDRLPKDFDPGRYRVESLFRALYGESEAAVTKNCVTVQFCGHSVRFNARCGAAEALSLVSDDLQQILKRKPELRPYVEKLAGTFNWRKVAGTSRLSEHAFGIAIDLNVDKSDYWRWRSPEQIGNFSRKNWPTEIIETFERHGFIWGGKWWHYDTMHFEYRPEMIAYARASAANQ
jgi:D-alanyl-D-alanine carboxypeptidase